MMGREQERDEHELNLKKFVQVRKLNVEVGVKIWLGDTVEIDVG